MMIKMCCIHALVNLNSPACCSHSVACDSKATKLVSHTIVCIVCISSVCEMRHAVFCVSCRSQACMQCILLIALNVEVKMCEALCDGNSASSRQHPRKNCFMT